jgi:hypothetical protein
VVQDNLTIITTQNGFSYRTDDYSDALDNSTYTIVPNSFSVQGIITTQFDKDGFKFDLTSSGPFHLEALPFSVNNNNAGANLDITLDIYKDNNNGNLGTVGSFSPQNSMSIVIDTSLDAGTYYIIVRSSGNSNTDAYGSIGSYQLIGIKNLLAIHDVSLTGNSSNGRHNLNWRITSDEPMASQTVEYSRDGADYIPLYEAGASAAGYSYTPPGGLTLYYRLKVISVTGQVAYSNVISLKSAVTNDRRFLISTLVSQTIRVNAPDNYRYRLIDLNGRVLSSGTGLSGINDINIMNQPGGMYLLQILSNNELFTQRIIKQ